MSWAKQEIPTFTVHPLLTPPLPHPSSKGHRLCTPFTVLLSYHRYGQFPLVCSTSTTWSDISNIITGVSSKSCIIGGGGRSPPSPPPPGIDNQWMTSKGRIGMPIQVFAQHALRELKILFSIICQNLLQNCMIFESPVVIGFMQGHPSLKFVNDTGQAVAYRLLSLCAIIVYHVTVSNGFCSLS